MVEATLRVGLVGVGRWGSKIARTLERLPGARIVGISDLAFGASGEPGSRSLSESWSEYRQYSTIEPLLDDPEIEAVIIATPPEHHHAMASKVLRADKHVFVEKPMALSVAEAEELSDLVEASERMLMVGHLLHYHPAMEHLFELVSQGELGRPLSFFSERMNIGPVQRGDAWWVLAPHDVSLSRRVFRADPRHVRARALGNSITASLQFRSGTAILRVAHASSKRARRLMLVGAHKTAFFEDALPEPTLALAPTTRALLDRTRAPSAEAWCWDELVSAAPGFERIAVSRTEPLASELSHFIACARQRRQPLTDAREGLAVTRIMVAGQHSLKHGGVEVSLPTERPRNSRTTLENAPFAAELS